MLVSVVQVLITSDGEWWWQDVSEELNLFAGDILAADLARDNPDWTVRIDRRPPAPKVSFIVQSNARGDGWSDHSVGWDTIEEARDCQARITAYRAPWDIDPVLRIVKRTEEEVQ